MTTWMWIAVAAGVVAVLLVGVFVLSRARQRRITRRAELRDRVGTKEYERVVDAQGERKAQRVLAARLEHHEELDLQRVSPALREELSEAWRVAQFRFVDEPDVALRGADHLLFETMQARGLPTSSIEERAEAISLEATGLADRYRRAAETTRTTDVEADVDVEAVRDAFLTYREIFEVLVGRPQREEPANAGGPPDPDSDPVVLTPSS